MIDPPDIEAIVDRQVSLWESRQRRHAEDPGSTRGRLLHLAEGPWVTVSAQCGSRGEELAEGLGARLGWQVFNREILHAIAGRTHAREKLLSRLDGHAVGVLQDYLAQLLVPDDPGQPGYVVELMSVVWAIARQGQAVIVGRGANWLLDPRFGLRARVIADLDRRAARIADARSIPVDQARQLVKNDDADRARFIRQVYRRDIDEPLGYDLVVNTGVLELGPAVESVLAGLTRKLLATE